MAQADRAALSTTEVLDRVLHTFDHFREFNLDDALWCYADEPRCQEARQMVGRYVGVSTKNELIAWCRRHERAEQRVVIEQLMARFERDRGSNERS